jgi:signal transduction histidine kinase
MPTSSTSVESNAPLLPRWASAAFVARCAQRFIDVLDEDAAEPSAVRTTVVEAVRLSEVRAERGGDVNDTGAVEVDGRYFDNYDLLSIRQALNAFAQAAENTLADLAEDPVAETFCRRNFVAISLAVLALDTAYPEEQIPNAVNALDEAIRWALLGEPELRAVLDEDLALVTLLAAAEGWNDQTGVSAKLLGPVWPKGRPTGWPISRLRFRPRARIIRTIGDRLISGPEAAAIELVKNSYDADATRVRISFLPPFGPNLGEIIFEDDGHGMSLSDVQERWMEPATSDKKERRESAGGRRLLGSKGIGRFAAARLGEHLELISTHRRDGVGEQTRIADLNWARFDEAQYLDDVSFPAEVSATEALAGTRLRIWSLRDEWTEAAMRRLHQELRRLIKPSDVAGAAPFRIFLNLSACTVESCGFDGRSIVETSGQPSLANPEGLEDAYEIRPFPVLEASDYDVDGVFDENGAFEGTMTIRRAGAEKEAIRLQVPLQPGEDPCGIVLVRLSIFDREVVSIRSTAELAGFGQLGVREARKLLDSIAGVAIYREGFRIRPYGDAENDWLTLDAKRVQNPSLKIGRNQVAGTIVVDDEEESQLIERSSREGLEENGSYRRLQNLLLALLAEVVEPRRRRFRLAVGLEKRKQSGFSEVLEQAGLGWAQDLLGALPENKREAAKQLIARESERLTGYLKDLEQRQALLEAQVTMGAIVGEVMHQGNTPLAFIENEVRRLQKWWPRLFDNSPDSAEDRAAVPTILNGLGSSAVSLRSLFNALRPLSGARRGNAADYSVRRVIDDVIFLFQTRADSIGLTFVLDPQLTGLSAHGYPSDLATALTNLVDNAFYWLEHYGTADKKIEINANLQPERITLFVQDNGPGVAEEFRDQLFDIGFTLKPTGTGLGLSIAREAIYRSGGELNIVDSELGAKFAISLPRT